jgi:hypothetical protein
VDRFKGASAFIGFSLFAFSSSEPVPAPDQSPGHALLGNAQGAEWLCSSVSGKTLFGNTLGAP